MKVIAEHGEFQLQDRQLGSGGWRSLKLVRRVPGRGRRIKRNWWFGWNGERLSGTKDARLLEEHLPDVHGWVMRILVGP